jgi:hypothetical protein
VQIGCLAGLAQAGSPGELDMGTRHHVCARRCWPLQLASRRASRQQVSEPIGSGQSSCCEQSRREAPGRAKAARPLTRETSAGSFAGAAGERARARAPEATTSEPLDTMLRRRPPSRSGSCFGRISVTAERSRLPTLLLNVHAHQRARDGARGDRSRLRRFDRSCSWIVLIAEVDERRLACHRMVIGLVSPSERGAKRRTGVGSRNATAKS